MAIAGQVEALFLERSRYYLRVEYWTKLRAALEALPADALWWRPNESANSAGNLVLHLSGNVRQWIVAGLGGEPDVRNRAAEFAAREGGVAGDLLADLDRTLAEADRVLGALAPTALLERRLIQGRDISALEAVFNVVEHFSHHVGQIIWIAKLKAPGAIRFVDDAGGLARPIWRELVRPPVVE